MQQQRHSPNPNPTDYYSNFAPSMHPSAPPYDDDLQNYATPPPFPYFAPSHSDGHDHGHNHNPPYSTTAYGYPCPYGEPSAAAAAAGSYGSGGNGSGSQSRSDLASDVYGSSRRLDSEMSWYDSGASRDDNGGYGCRSELGSDLYRSRRLDSRYDSGAFRNDDHDSYGGRSDLRSDLYGSRRLDSRYDLGAFCNDDHGGYGNGIGRSRSDVGSGSYRSRRLDSGMSRYDSGSSRHDHRGYGSRAAGLYPSPSPGSKKVVLKLHINEEKAKKKAIEAVSKVAGIEVIAVDMKEKKLTVIGNVDVVTLVKKVRKLCHTETISVGPAEEPEKKKDGGRKDEHEHEEEMKRMAEFVRAKKAYNPQMTQYYYVPSVEENQNSCYWLIS